MVRMFRAGRMKLLAIICIATWVVVLVLLSSRAIWAHRTLAATTGSAPTIDASGQSIPEARLHTLMLVSEIRDFVLALVPLIAAVVFIHSHRRVSLIVMTVSAVLCLLVWVPSLVIVLCHTDISPFTTPNSSTFLSTLFRHPFLERGLRCLLAGVGLVCAAMGLSMRQRQQEAERPPPADGW